jgi:hypothetical protein
MSRQDGCQTSVDFCHANGWCVGDILEGDEGNGPDRIRITAIGEDHLLARHISHGGDPVDDGQEELWTFRYRDWKKVNGP